MNFLGLMVLCFWALFCRMKGGKKSVRSYGSREGEMPSATSWAEAMEDEDNREMSESSRAPFEEKPSSQVNILKVLCQYPFFSIVHAFTHIHY